ncbi:MAG: S8 family serine peptidase, partial [bacterium]
MICVKVRQPVIIKVVVFCVLGFLSAGLGFPSTTYDSDFQGQDDFIKEYYEFEVEDSCRILYPGFSFSQGSRTVVNRTDIGVPPEGDCPIAIAITPDGTLAIIANRDSDNITMIDLITNEIDTVLPVGDYPCDIAITPDAQYAFIPNLFSGNVSVVDIPNRTVLPEITTGGQPVKVKITSDGTKALVGALETLELIVIDIGSMTIVNTIPDIPLRIYGGGGSFLSGRSWFSFTEFDVTPDGTTAIFPCIYDDNVLLYDISTGTCDTVWLAANSNPKFIDISSNGNFAIILNTGDVIDIPNRSVIANLGTNSDHGVITPDDNLVVFGQSNNTAIVDVSTPSNPVIVANLSTIGSTRDVGVSGDSKYGFIVTSNRQSIIDLELMTISKSFSLGKRGQEVSTVSQTDYKAVTSGYITCERIHIFNIDGMNGSLEATLQLIPEGDAPIKCVRVPGKDLAITVNSASDNISLVDIITNEIVNIINVGALPVVITVTHNGVYAVVTNHKDNNVSIIDLNLQQVVATVPTMSNSPPSEVTITPDDSLAVVVSYWDLVSVIKLDGVNSSLVGGVQVGNTGTVIVINSNETSKAAVSSDGATAIIPNNLSDDISIIDIPGLTEVARINVGDCPIRIAFTTTGDTALVTNMFSDDVSVIHVDGANSALVTTVPCGADPFDIEITPDGQYAAVSNTNGQSITIIDMNDFSVAQTIPLGDLKPRDIAIMESGALLSLNTDFFLAGGMGNLQYIEFDGMSHDITEIAAFVDVGVFSLDYHDEYAVVSHCDVDSLSIVYDISASGYSDISTNPTELVIDYSTKKLVGLKPCPAMQRITSSRIAEDLVEKLQYSSGEELIPVLIMMSEQINSDFLVSNAAKSTKPERRQWVSSQLRSLAQRTQQKLVSYLESEKQNGIARNIRSLWILNAISAEVTKDIIAELAVMSGVSEITYDGNYFQVLGGSGSFGIEGPVAPSDRAIVWNVEKIRADVVWAAGCTGNGIIIGNIDTGVNYNHTDLADHMWDGGSSYPNHGWDFANNDNDPMDDNGHGTHTAGTNAGDGTSGTQTGVAPDALIMALKTQNASGGGNLSDIAAAIQFCIDQGADVLSISLGAENPSQAIKDYCRSMCYNAFAADLPIAAAAGNGNTGGGHYSVPHDIYSPGDVPAPWYGSAGHNAVMAVGATNSSDIIASFSSYGPTEWTDYPYPPGLIKPDVSAPGVNITSLSYTNNTGYVSGWSGTSMACPHLAGTIALMLEKNPLLTCVEIDSIIENFGVVDLGTSGRDNYYGAGRIDAYDAFLAVAENTTKKGTFQTLNAGSATKDLSVSNIIWTASWIKDVNPTYFSVDIGDSCAVDVYVDSASLAPGTYSDVLWIYSNDPDENPYPEPITLIMGTDVIPPERPYVNAEKPNATDTRIYWHPVTTDTLGNPEVIDGYIIYRNTDPSFIPAHADSIGYTASPDTVYTDVGVLPHVNTYYYLIKAVDNAHNRSRKSNMAYKFNKFFNENAGATSDKNWTSLPWYSEYAVVSDLTADLSASGDPLTGLTNLRDDQLYESWLYNPIFGWTGTDFSIVLGCSYEMVTINDTSLVFVGANDPNGLVVLNENPGLSDKNWVSIPYNAAYSTVSDITAEYGASGDPLTGLTNLRDDQLYESWLYNPIFGWTGTNFSIVPGRGYELVVITDTVWNPTEYTNEAKQMVSGKRVKKLDSEIYLGRSTEPGRAPAWVLKDDSRKSDAELSDRKNKDQSLSIDDPMSGHSDNKSVHLDTDLYEPVSRHKLTDVSTVKSSREPGISHNVFVHLAPDDLNNIVFTAYRMDNPADVLTEHLIGCGVVKKDDQTGIWFNTGNFKKPWQDTEEVILIIEATKKGRTYFNVVSFALNKDVDIQNLGEVLLAPIPDVRTSAGLVSWHGIDNDYIIGYSLYQDDKRLNEKVITTNDYAATGEVHLRPIIRGGYETV